MENVVEEKKLTTSDKDYRLLHFIGQGTYGLSTLWIAEHTPSKSYIALRRTEIDKLDAQDLESIQYEMKLSSELHHPGILSFYCAFVASKEIVTVYPFYNYGSCADIIQAGFPQGLPETTIAFILRGTLTGLEYLHRMGYVHRAVKGSHILVSSEGRICLTGLRYCKYVINEENARVAHDFPNHAVAVLPWIAPEVLQQNLLGYSDRSDIYSVGITLLELANGQVPFSGMPPTQILLEKLNGQVPQVAKSSSTANLTDRPVEGSSGTRIGSPQPSPQQSKKKLASAFQQVLEACLAREPLYRPSAADLRNYSLFKQIKKKSSQSLCISDLLYPVNPIKDVSSLSLNESDLPSSSGSLTGQMQQLSLQDEWTF